MIGHLVEEGNVQNDHNIVVVLHPLEGPTNIATGMNVHKVIHDDIIGNYNNGIV